MAPADRPAAGAGVRIRAISTGTVRVKRAHRRLTGPAATRLAAILADPRWTEPLPILAWLIEHPEGRLLVDTGETARHGRAGWFDDPVTPRILRLGVAPEDEPDATLRPDRIVLTHLHTDHTGNLDRFPGVEVLASRTELERPPAGAVPSSWPRPWAPTAIDFGDGPVGAFDRSHRLTQAGDVRLVPTPGHTHGHLSVLVDRGADQVLVAGDACFSAGQVRRQEVAGIVADVGAARDTLARLARLATDRPTVLLPSHDPCSVERLARGEHHR